MYTSRTGWLGRTERDLSQDQGHGRVVRTGTDMDTRWLGRTERDLCQDQGYPDGDQRDKVRDEEGAATVAEAEEREPPDVADADHGADAGQDEGGPRLPSVPGLRGFGHLCEPACMEMACCGALQLG